MPVWKPLAADCTSSSPPESAPPQVPSGRLTILSRVASRQVPLWAVGLVSVVLVGTAIAMALSSIAVAGDGAYYLVRILDGERVFGPELRMFGNAVRQVPVLLAARAGVTDTHVLSVTFGLGLFLVPVAAWCLAVLWARAEDRVFAAVAMVAGLCAGTTWFFAVGENVIAVPLTALVAVLLWLPRAWAWPHALVAGAASTILVATYETSLVSSALVVVWAAWRARVTETRPDTIGAAAVAGIAALSIVTALAGVQAGQEKTPDHVQSLLFFVVSLTPWPLYLGLVANAAIVAALSPELDRTPRIALLVVGSLSAAVTVYGLAPTTPTAFAARGGAPIAAILLQLLLFGLWIRAGRGARDPRARTRGVIDSRWLLLVPILFVAGMAFGNLRALTSWSRSFEAFQAEVARTCDVNVVDEVLPADRRQVVWGWASSSLSLIVRRDPDAGVLADRDPSFVPFPPSTARDQLPDEYVWGG